MDDIDMEEGGDEGQIAIEALKEMRTVLRAAMSRMPNAEAPEEEVPEEIEDPIMEETEEASMEPAMEEEAPVVEKKTVLASITPKYGGESSMPPEMAALGKLKAKKKGF